MQYDALVVAFAEELAVRNARTIISYAISTFLRLREAANHTSKSH